MKLERVVAGPFAENTYLLHDNKQCLLIDPGFYSEAEFGKFKERLQALEAGLTAVILTHAHLDHVLGLRRVVQEFEAPVYLCHKDLYLWENVEMQGQMFGFPFPAFDFTPRELPVRDEWSIGPASFEVRYTPGHAPDHVSLYLKEQGWLLGGDVLFRESIGRTDLYKGDFDVLAQSIREQVYTLPADTKVWPGHGPETTVSHEKANNPFVNG